MTPTEMPPLTLVPVPGKGPEDVALAEDGTVYTALRTDGRLFRLAPGAAEVELVAELGGKGLGVEAMPDGRVLVCNADLGLQVVDPRTGRFEAILPEVFGRPFGICNNASLAQDGTIYFSESSTRYHLAEFRRDLVEDTRTGSLMRWRPGEAEPEVLLDGIGFANGVALDPEERFVLLAETGHERVHRVWLTGDRAGQKEVFAEVAGYPDNLSVGSDGLFWLAIPAEPSPALDRVQRMPSTQREAARELPEGERPRVPRLCRVAAYDAAGELVHRMDGDPTRYHDVTGLRERDGTVWIGSIAMSAIGRFELPR